MKKSNRKNLSVRSCKPCGEQSPYWNWLEQHSVNSEGDILEPLEANPDRIGEEDCEDPKTELLDALKVGWKLLTDRERHIVVQCSKGKTCEEIAVTLHISKQAVAQSLQNGRKKIFSILEESND